MTNAWNENHLELEGRIEHTATIAKKNAYNTKVIIMGG